MAMTISKTHMIRLPWISSALHPIYSYTSLRDRMDLLEFTDFVLAWDHRSSPAAIKYFFPIFDLQKKVARGVIIAEGAE